MDFRLVVTAIVILVLYGLNNWVMSDQPQLRKTLSGVILLLLILWLLGYAIFTRG